MTDKEEDIRFYSAYAQAVIAGLERLKSRTGSLTPPQEAELAVNKIALGVLQPQIVDLHEKLNPAPYHVPVTAVVVTEPKAQSTGPKWEPVAAGGRCLLCFAENVNVTPDPDGVPRCASCWEDLQPCVNCGIVSTRPGGEHYCTSTPRVEPNPAPEDDIEQHRMKCGKTGHRYVKTDKVWTCCYCGLIDEDGPE